MKKSKTLFLLATIAIMGGIAASLYYFWHQLTELPQWYAHDAPRSEAQIQKSSAAVEKKIASQVQATQPSSNKATNTGSSSGSSRADTVQVALNSEELNDLLVTRIVEKSGGKSIPESVKGIQTSVQNNTLKTGAVVDVKALQNSNLGTHQKALLNEVTQRFPVGDRKVYIGVEGKPAIQNGKLHFDENAKIQVGNMSFTIAEVANRLGVPPEKVQDQLNLELKLRGFNASDIDFADGNAILRGSASR